MTPDPREEACNRFIDGERLAFIKVKDIGGTRTCILFGEDGDEIALSAFGMTPLISYAVGRGMTVCAVH